LVHQHEAQQQDKTIVDPLNATRFPEIIPTAELHKQRIDGEISAALQGAIPSDDSKSGQSARIDEHVPGLNAAGLRGRAQGRFNSLKRARQELRNRLPKK
jgi:hypothetical protein